MRLLSAFHKHTYACTGNYFFSITLIYILIAKTNQREVVDNSFTYNLVATFKNMTDINVYESHPIHLDAIKKYSHFWDKVVVHDSMLM